MAEGTLEREWHAPFLVDVRRTLSVQGRGRGDPTFTADEAGAIWRTSLTPDGPATIRVLPGRPLTHAAEPTQADQLARTTKEAPGATTGVRAQAWALARSGYSMPSLASWASMTIFRDSRLLSPMPTR